ncbi:MAG: Crp/Fnr family transcriptional regulator [bacterium]
MEILNTSELFGGLSPELQRKISSQTFFEKYSRGEIVFREGELVHGLYIVVEGQAKGYRTSIDGRQQIVRIINPGDIIAEAVLLEGEKYPVTLEILRDTRFLYLPADKFISFLKDEPAAALELISVLSKRLRFLVRVVDDLSLKEVSARLASYLLQQVEKQNKDFRFNEQITLPVSKTELAFAMGTISETLSRTLKKIEQTGAIENRGKKILILDHKKLTEIAAGEKI